MTEEQSNAVGNPQSCTEDPEIELWQKPSRNSACNVLLHWLEEKRTNQQPTLPHTHTLVGNLLRIGKKSEMLICIYTDPVHQYLRKWTKSYKAACWSRGTKERARLGQQPSVCCQSPRSRSILQGQSSLSTACQIGLKTWHIHNPFSITSNSVNFSRLKFSVNENLTFAEQIQDKYRENKTLFKLKSLPILHTCIFLEKEGNFIWSREEIS